MMLSPWRYAEVDDWETKWSIDRLQHGFGLDDFRISSRQDDNGEPSPYYSDFGENILGIKSMTDLKDLIAAKDKEFQVLQTAISSTPTSSPPWPPNGYAAWYKDYQALVSVWQPARTTAMAAITAAWGPSNLQTGQPYYDNLLHIIQPITNTTTPGSLPDLFGRLNAVQAVPSYIIPQPTKDADQQLALSQALAPFDPIGNAKARDDWEKTAILVGSILIGGLLLAASMANKVTV
jgi:hypothetical protein